MFLVLALLVVGGGTVAAVPNRFGISGLAVEHQAAKQGLLGIVATNFNETIGQLLGLDNTKGAVIIRVAVGSPAATAGLKIRDVITAVKGTPVANVGELRKALAGADAQVSLTIIRDGAAQTMNVTRKPAEEWLVLTGPAWLPELNGIKASETFAHYLGSQQMFLDKDGKKHTVVKNPGIVTEVKDNSLSMTPNGQSTPVTFTVTDKTVISVPGSKLSGIKSGDKIVITTVDSSQEARLITSGARIGRHLLGMDRFLGRMF